MVNVLIGRGGEDLHAFDLDDIKNGALRDSGLFPELYESTWPSFTSGVLVTGVERKLHEHRSALSYGEFDFPLFTPPSILTRALEDSKEEETSHEGIASGKLHKGFIGPLRSELSNLTRTEKTKFARSIAQRANVRDLKHLVAFADDRSMTAPHAFLDPVYGHLNNHWNDQVKEVFTQEKIPGVRVKEADGANYGPANSVYLYNKAKERIKLIATDKFTMDTLLCVQPVIPGVLPLPEQGLIFKASGTPYDLKQFDERDLAKIKKGRILNYDHFTLLSGFEDETTLNDLKQKYPQHYYLAHQHSPGVAMTAFAHAANLPTLKDNRRKKRPVYLFNQSSRKQSPKTIVSSGALITNHPSREEIRSTLAFPTGMRLSYKNGETLGGLKSLRALEEYAYSGQAFVVQDPDQFEAKPTDNLSAEDVTLLRRLETDLIYAYLITMSTQAGAPNHIGRSHMVEKSYFKKRGLWHPDFANMGLAGDAETEAYRLYKNGEELISGLKEWDETMYQHQVQIPANDFLNEKNIKKILGKKDLGYVVSGYGSASAFIDNAYKDAHAMFHALSQLDQLTTIDGGGVRSAMLGLKEGTLKALSEGFNVSNIGVRSESDVSPLEGDITDWIENKGFKVETGQDPRHLHFADNQMQILKLSRLLQRQAPIAALSDISLFFPGGKGTVVEICLTKLHNARVQLTGEGLFKGFNSNNKTIPLVFIDHEFEHLGEKRGIFDKVLTLDPEYHDLLDIHIFKGKDRIKNAIDFVKRHASSQGFNLEPQNTKPGFLEPI